MPCFNHTHVSLAHLQRQYFWTNRRKAQTYSKTFPNPLQLLSVSQANADDAFPFNSLSRLYWISLSHTVSPYTTFSFFSLYTEHPSARCSAVLLHGACLCVLNEIHSTSSFLYSKRQWKLNLHSSSPYYLCFVDFLIRVSYQISE